ncbi:hypothetical protein J6590_066433 [Homalodisca vitripennis]|nr:hypothetical protein J6590_066433 [Homalodisca vitripennis]
MMGAEMGYRPEPAVDISVTPLTTQHNTCACPCFSRLGTGSPVRLTHYIAKARPPCLGFDKRCSVSAASPVPTTTAYRQVVNNPVILQLRRTREFRFKTSLAAFTTFPITVTCTPEARIGVYLDMDFCPFSVLEFTIMSTEPRTALRLRSCIIDHYKARRYHVPKPRGQDSTIMSTEPRTLLRLRSCIIDHHEARRYHVPRPRGQDTAIMSTEPRTALRLRSCIIDHHEARRATMCQGRAGRTQHNVH